MWKNLIKAHLLTLVYKSLNDFTSQFRMFNNKNNKKKLYKQTILDKKLRSKKKKTSHNKGQ